MSNVSGASLTPISERLFASSTYHPLSAETFSDWSIEAGDIVTVSREDTDYQSPVHSLHMTWRGTPKVEINSVGKEKRDTVSIQSARKYGRSGSSQKNTENLYYEVMSEDGSVHSAISMTATQIMTTVGDTISGMAQSVIDQTSTYIHMEVSNAASSISQSVIEQTTSYIVLTVSSVASGVAYSVIEQTMTGIIQKVERRARVWVQWVDPSTVAANLPMMDGDLWYKKKVSQTWDEISTQNWNALEDYKWADLYGLRHYVWRNNAWHLVLDTAKVVESSVQVEQDNEHWAVLARQMDIQGQESRSNLTVTAQKINSDVSAANSQLYSTIEQTATYIMAEVVDVENGLSSEIEVTASQIRTEVNNSVSQLQSSITQQANRISLVVQGTGANARIKAAQIAIAINEQGSEAFISADKIKMDGNTTISDVLSVQNNGSGNKGIAVDGKSVFQNSLYVINHNLSAGNLIDLQYALISATVSGDTLTLTNAQGEKVNFSKATTLTGSWGSGANTGKFTVVASPQDKSYYATVYVDGNGNPTKVANWSTLIEVPVKIMSYVNGGNTPVDTGYSKNQQVNVANLLQEKTFTTNGDKTPDDGYVGFSKVTVNFPSYTNYSFSKTRTQDSDGYHYTFTISTGWSTPFGASGGTYTLYKRN